MVSVSHCPFLHYNSYNNNYYYICIQAKCEKYWPNTDSTMQHGGVNIKTKTEDEYLDHIYREFEATVGKKTRKVV
jgi:hypothetical protein